MKRRCHISHRCWLAYSIQFSCIVIQSLTHQQTNKKKRFFLLLLLLFARFIHILWATHHSNSYTYTLALSLSLIHIYFVFLLRYKSSFHFVFFFFFLFSLLLWFLFLFLFHSSIFHSFSVLLLLESPFYGVYNTLVQIYIIFVRIANHTTCKVKWNEERSLKCGSAFAT